MALIHQAELTPTKPELLRSWVPTQPWSGDPGSLEVIGAYRFDDPDGQVGIETHLLSTPDGVVLQVPLTYRAAPLVGAEPFLLTQMQHSVLGTRWVYDGCADPVYVSTLAATILRGGREADLDVENRDGTTSRRESSVTVYGSGGSDTAVPAVDAVSVAAAGPDTLISSGSITVAVRRRLDADYDARGTQVLFGRWPDQSDPIVLATARVLG